MDRIGVVTVYKIGNASLVELARLLAAHPDLERAVLEGRLDLRQAAVIAAAVTAIPDTLAELDLDLDGLGGPDGPVTVDPDATDPGAAPFDPIANGFNPHADGVVPTDSDSTVSALSARSWTSSAIPSATDSGFREGEPVRRGPGGICAPGGDGGIAKAT